VGSAGEALRGSGARGLGSEMLGRPGLVTGSLGGVRLAPAVVGGGYDPPTITSLGGP
jgi:hypothetical protein